MAFKINVSHKGRTVKFEVDNENIVGTKIGGNLDGKEIDSSLEGYEFEVTGTSDKAGFCGMPKIDGPGLKKVLLTYGMGMRKKPKRFKKDPGRPKGLRLRKTVRGNEISLDTVQINCKVIKEGAKKFDDLGKIVEAPIETTEAPKEEVKEEKVEEKKEMKEESKEEKK